MEESCPSRAVLVWVDPRLSVSISACLLSSQKTKQYHRDLSADCLVYTRGTFQDIDTWAQISGDESWGWDAMLPYFMKVI